MMEVKAPQIHEDRWTFCQILNEDFQQCRNLVIKGGWGYGPNDAIILQATLDMVSIEYLIVEKRLYEELIIFRPKGNQYAGIEWHLKNQALKMIDGHHYDHLVFDVTAFHEKDWEYLTQDWSKHQAYVGDSEGLAKHEAEREKRQIHFVTEYWFDISKKFQ
ncbi:MAG: hypothetical protein J6V64_06720 [Burkholderiaceae bacterium]|nr:hypothetical protein [Burkholderiaceae bacterium]